MLKKIMVNYKLKKLKREYSFLMKKAIDAQRNGNIELFGKISSQAEIISTKIDSLEKQD